MKIYNEIIKGLRKALRTRVVNLAFVKKNGDLRAMKCTLNFNIIPTESHPKGGGVIVDEEHPESIRVYDVEAEGWRTVIFDAITEIEGQRL
jgi:hypothetical protein